MSEKKKVESLPRREFLKAGISTGALGVAVVALSSGQAKAANVPEGGSVRAGYRETEHVLKYYELARF